MQPHPPKARAVKYPSDTVFGDTPAAPPTGPRARSSYSADEVERIRGETFAAGKADAEVVASALKAGAHTNVRAGPTSLPQQMDAMGTRLRSGSVETARAVARKMDRASPEALSLK